jgi:hypothetical protein
MSVVVGRTDDLESGPSPDQSAAPSAAAPIQTAPVPHDLQDVLPEISRIAQKVGGMKQLAEIAKTLERGNE